MRALTLPTVGTVPLMRDCPQLTPSIATGGSEAAARWWSHDSDDDRRRAAARPFSLHPLSRAARPAGRGRRAEPVGPLAERVREHVLRGRGALDGVELARVPLRLARFNRVDDRGQAAARALGAGALGARIRLPFFEHPRP